MMKLFLKDDEVFFVIDGTSLMILLDTDSHLYPINIELSEKQLQVLKEVLDEYDI